MLTSSMTSAERVESAFTLRPSDRIPMVEFAPYWDKTVLRWKKEGLPEGFRVTDKPLVDSETHAEMCEYFGLDVMTPIWVGSRKPDCPAPKAHGHPLISDEIEYQEFRRYLYPVDPVGDWNRDLVYKLEQRGQAWWVFLDGFFRFPRILLGIEDHLYAFIDKPELMRAINRDNLEYLLRAVDKLSECGRPQFITISEDMTYNLGPMISRDCFDDLLAPLYVELISYIKSKGIKVFIDSDGLIDDIIEWFLPLGCDGFLPLERNAGVDIVEYRRRHPRLLMVGGFDKLVMTRGEEAIRAEFERILPVMRQGGYLPSVDHQTPPEVSLEQYRLYIEIFREYARKAVTGA